MKRVLSALLCILMIVSVFASGTTAYAEKGGGGGSGIKLTYEQAKAVYDKVETFDHVDVRLYGTFTTADGTEKSATVSNPSITIYKEDGTVYRTETFTNTTKYEWRMTGLKVPKSAKIVVTCDVTVDDVTKKDMTFTYEGEEDFIQAIRDCDFGQGLDFNIAGAEIQQQFYYYVTYDWTGLPDNLKELPTDVKDYLPNAEVTVDTSFKSGDTCKDKEGNVYTFSGWTEYEPKGGSRIQLNGAASFAITADTVIYGSWSKYTPPTTEPGSITITKSFAGLPENLRPDAVSFSVTGPDNYSTTVTLNTENGWSATISGLSEGSYTITEGAADVDGYVYASNFTGGSTTVTLTKSALDTDTNKYTVSSETAAFENTYTRLGSLKIVKDFGADSELNKDSANIGKFVFSVAGSDGFETRTIELPIASSETPWEFTLEDLPAGDYTVTEDPASAARDSYNLTINDAGEEDDAVTVSVNNGSTAEAKITNTYTKNISGEIHNPASFKIVKTDGQDNKLSGAEFTLTPENGGEAITQTTDANGEAVFSGFVNEAKYTLKETKAPEGYVATEQTWTVTVKLKDGDPTIQISEDGKFWNKIYNWVVSSDPKDVDGVLTVTNTRQTGSLVIKKTVENNKKLGPEAEEYTFSLTIGGEKQTFTLKAGESKTIENIPYGTDYQVDEEVSEDASWNVVSPVGGKAKGTISQEETTVDFVNRYEYADEAEMVVFSAVKQSSKDGKALAGAEFTVYSDKDCKTSVATATTDANGKLAFGFKSAGSFYLKETKAPSGYVLSDKVIELTVTDKGYVVDRVENEDQTDTTTIVPALELTVKGAELLTGSTSMFLLENDPESYIDITVNKLWKNDKEAGKRPETITVTLYKDGVKYDSKTISEKDKWTCTWKNLPSQYKWTVDESNLPAGYTKSITQKGNTFTITNTYSSIVGTGDSSAPILWALLVLTTAAGAVLTIRKLRKEKG